jgi:hypothetical protein
MLYSGREKFDRTQNPLPCDEYLFPISIKLLKENFDKRDNLKREKAYKQEVSCDFVLGSQAGFATFSRNFL